MRSWSASQVFTGGAVSPFSGVDPSTGPGRDVVNPATSTRSKKGSDRRSSGGTLTVVPSTREGGRSPEDVFALAPTALIAG
jgi:hypothetical protein